VLVCALVPGIVVLVLGRAHHLVAGEAAAHKGAWSVATITFAVGQAAAAYGFSYLYAAGQNYARLFAVAACAAAAALIIDFAAPFLERYRR
jgi:hypothetical protein